MKALVIFNPVAGKGRGAVLGLRASERLRAAGWEATVMESASPQQRLAANEGDAVASGCKALLTAAARARAVLVVGGDGTLREVLTDLQHLPERPPLAIVPAGNANVLAREYAIPLDPDAAVDLVLKGTTQAVDCGVANERLFLAMAGVGYDAVAVKLLHWVRSTRPGALLYRLPRGADCLYLIAGLLALFRFRPVRVAAELDARPRVTGLASVSVLNTAQYAKHWSVVPSALAHDGIFDTREERGAFFLRPLCALVAAMLRRRAPAFIARYGRATRVVLHAPRAFAWQLDGDAMPPAARLDVTLRAAFFDLFVPARTAGP
jgi:diacylglycerol kinase family enzyme